MRHRYEPGRGSARWRIDPARLAVRLALGAALLGVGMATAAGGSAARAQDPEPGEPGVARVEGVDSGHPRAVAIELCRVRHPDAESIERIALARDDEFADALAGSSLPGAGCILFTPGGPDEPLHPDVRAEIDRVMVPGGGVYVLGGRQAVSEEVTDELSAAGYEIARLAGATRFETAEAIAMETAREIALARDEVIVANGLEWVDAITAGGYAARQATPVVITPAERLHPAAERVIEQLDPQRTLVIGGTAAISDRAAGATQNPERVAGPNRMRTAVAVAEQMWPRVEGFAGDAFVVANLERGDGWVPALAATRLSGAWDAPQLGVWTDAYPGETEGYLQGRAFDELPSVTLLGDGDFISSETADRIRADIQPE